MQFSEKLRKEEDVMGRYRTYKNGIYGHRHNGYYVVMGKEGKGDFSILNSKGEIVKEKVYDFEEGIWIIDKMTVSDYELSMMKQLYTYQIFELSKLFLELVKEEERDEKSKLLYKWCNVNRKRKIEEREF